MDQSGRKKMSMREAMITLAGRPFHYGEQRRWFKQVADSSDLSVRTVRSLWRGEIHDHNHWAFKSLQRALEIKIKDDQLKQARTQAKALAAQYQSIIGGLRAKDAPFFSEEITRLERLVRELGALDRAGT